MLPYPLVDVIPRLPLAARTLLHTGCGDGALAAALRPVNPRARLFGIEPDASLAATAATMFDSVVTADPARHPLPFDLPDGLDCLVYAGVLETLADPWSLIARQAEVLTPDGVVLMDLPNPAAWQEIERILRGTPLHGAIAAASFTAETVLRQLPRIGLVPCDVTECLVDRGTALPFVEAMRPALAALGIDAEAFARRISPARLLWRLRREARTRMFIGGSMLAPVGGVSHVRVIYPLQALATDPSVITEVTDRLDTSPPTDDSARLFVLHRPALAGAEGRDLVHRLGQGGHVLITEFDDNPDVFPMMKLGGQLSFEGVHAIQTSTPALADLLRAYNPEIAVFPNAVVSLPAVRNFASPDVITLFFGALNREDDWQPLMPVLNDVAQMAGERLRFQVVHDQGFFDALQTPYKTFTPTCDHDTYMHILGGCEISLMPLDDTAFNRCKSDLKFIEAAACRVLALASPVVYGETLEHGRTGLLFRSPQELRLHLLRTLALLESVREIADAARAYVTAERMLSYQVAPRLAWYRSLWDRREALEQARRQRLAAYAIQAA